MVALIAAAPIAAKREIDVPPMRHRTCTILIASACAGRLRVFWKGISIDSRSSLPEWFGFRASLFIGLKNRLVKMPVFKSDQRVGSRAHNQHFKMNIFRPFAVSVVAVATLLALPGCNTARVQHTWTDPSVKQISYKRLFVVAPATSEVDRRAFEESLRESLPANVVPSFTALPTLAEVDGLARVRKALADADCDGLAIVRLISDKKDLSYVPNSLADYWGTGASIRRSLMVPAPATDLTKTVVAEVSLYNVKTEKLQWAGTIESVNLSNSSTLASEVAAAVSARLRAQGLIK